MLNEFMPVFHFNEVHAIAVRATPNRVFRSIKEVTPEEVPPLRMLFSILSWGRRLTGGGELGFGGAQPVLARFLNSGFVLLAEQSGRELVIGTVGRFWSWTSKPPKLADAQEFLRFDRPNYAKAALNFRVDESHGDATIRVSTETRIYAAEPAARKRFAAYWRLIHPASAFSRRAWLAAIKRRAERA